MLNTIYIKNYYKANQKMRQFANTNPELLLYLKSPIYIIKFLTLSNPFEIAYGHPVYKFLIVISALVKAY
jgi:hypothetical protein